MKEKKTLNGNNKILLKDYSKFNYIGFKTMYKRETQRFLKVATQTLVAPAITTILFYMIFAVALKRSVIEINGVPFSEFLAPGLICMAILQNSFANTSSSILISKVQGNIVDILMPPVSEKELILAYSLGGMTRGILVGIVVAFTIYLFVPGSIFSIFHIFFFSVSSALFLSCLGILCGIWAEKFDHMAAITNFVIVPLTFLSGTFYSVLNLPVFWQNFTYINPFFYMIDGFRYGILGINDSNIISGIIILTLANIVSLILCMYILKSGYKLKT